MLTGTTLPNAHVCVSVCLCMNRDEINEMVSIAFNRSVVNSYSGRLNKDIPAKDKLNKLRRNKQPAAGNRRLQQQPNTWQRDYDLIPKHMMETVRSRFVLCPSGLSMDSYRLWETLVLVS
jgi:hypothetical protein